MKTIKIYTLGCKVNQYDSRCIAERFRKEGFIEAGKDSEADLCVINTCTVTHRADADSFNTIRKAIRQNPGARIMVAGCLAKTDPAKIRSIFLQENRSPPVEPFSPQRTIPSGITGFGDRTRAFLKVQDGCNNFCSYCKVPYARGRSKSRDMDEIIKEAKGLAKKGYKEIVLCGICLGAFGKDAGDRSGLVGLIGRMEEIPGLSRIRLSSIEPMDVTGSLIKKMAVSKKLCRHFHIPLQSGDDKVLKAMNRAYSSAYYSRLIKKIKKAVPLAAITTDVMVGFPAEDKVAFKNTVRLVKNTVPLKAHIFPYSPRPGTRAYDKYPGGPDPVEQKKRAVELGKISELCAEHFKKSCLNKAFSVLVEGRSKKDRAYWEGHTDNYLKVCFKSGMQLKNKMVDVVLKQISGDCIIGVKKE